MLEEVWNDNKRWEDKWMLTKDRNDNESIIKLVEKKEFGW